MTHSPATLQLPLYARLLTGQPLDMVKLVAVLAMLVDHVNAMWYGSQHLWAYLIGRTAFPLFCWAAAASLLRARDDRAIYKQAGILLICAVLTEPVSQLTRDYSVVNVLFTLGLGVAVAPLVLSQTALMRMGLSLGAIALTFYGGLWEFATAGMLFPVVLAAYLREGRALDLLAALLLAATMNFRGAFFYEESWWWVMAATSMAAVGFPVLVLWLVGEMSPARGADMGATRSGRRLMPRYVLHVFYPLHLLVLWLLK